MAILERLKRLDELRVSGVRNIALRWNLESNLFLLLGFLTSEKWNVERFYLSLGIFDVLETTAI